jgi:hypothetical protein
MYEDSRKGATMSGLTNSRDQTWEKVIEILASDGRLDRFFKTPRHERKAALLLHGRIATRDLTTLFSLVQTAKEEDIKIFLESLEAYRSIAMIQILVRSMQCWTETESLIPRGVKSRSIWQVANA